MTLANIEKTALTGQFFEGPEKKFEVVVSSERSLRAHSADWQRVVTAAQAQVISTLENEHVTAYLLSESSLFVYDGHATMITCGRTRLVDAIEEMLKFIPAQEISLLVYERKNEHFPEAQPTSFFDDATRLNALLPGRAFQFGAQHSHFVNVFCHEKSFVPDAEDTTLEILMHGLGQDTCEHFFHRGGQQKHDVLGILGLDRTFVGFDKDQHFFQPAGYSMNGVRAEDYYTIHVTPERFGSYVSFETNLNFRDNYAELIASVVDVFRPAAFDVITFCPGPSPTRPSAMAGFTLGDSVKHRVAGYNLHFSHYFRDLRGDRLPSEFVFG